jgi:hypothetical protein
MEGPGPRPIGASRHFVVLRRAEPASVPYIVAETVRDGGAEGDHRELSIAGALAGVGARILTEAELVVEAGGNEALVLWREGDDEVFHEIDRVLSATDDGGRDRAPLRLVHSEPESPALLVR